MTKILFLTFFSFFIGCLYCFAQEPISDEKKKLIAEIIVATKAVEKSKETMHAMLAHLNDSYPALVKAILEKDKTLSKPEKLKMEAEVLKRNASLKAKFMDRLFQKISFEDYVEQATTAAYGKLFSVNELNDLLTFYQTPTGRKLSESATQIALEAANVMQEILYPKIAQVGEEIIREDIKNTKKQMSPK